MFRGLTLGLLLAVVAIFLLLTAYFQSMRLALVALATVPAVLAGVAAWRCWSPGRRSTFNRSWARSWRSAWRWPTRFCSSPSPSARRRDGQMLDVAAHRRRRSRLRPILMTSFAMIAGMMPMALGLGEGGEQTAPLGRAVIGGLLAATRDARCSSCPRFSPW